MSDSQKREVYDRYGEEGLNGDGGMGGMNAEDIFSQFFGGGGGMFGGGGRQRPRGPRKGKDLVHRIKVSLEDLYKGKTSKLALQKHVICAKCEGRGGKEGAVKTCTTCNGSGVRIVMRQLGPMLQQMQQQCPDCNGEGEIIKDKDRCKECKGKKIINERKVLEVHIDKGMKDGQTITFAGEADQAPGTVPGDVIIVVEEKEHERFKRRGDDLFYEAKVDLLTALAGGSFAIEHLDDRVLHVQILPGEIIKPGETKMIESAGMPALRHHTLGNLYVTFEVEFPDVEWTQDKERLQALEAILPSRKTLASAPKGAAVEEVMLSHMDAAQQQRAAHAAANGMDEDDEEGGAGPQVQCANQ